MVVAAQHDADGPALSIPCQSLSIEAVIAASRRERRVVLDRSPDYVEHIERGAAMVDAMLDRRLPLYGVNTGYGSKVVDQLDADDARQLPMALLRYHCVGLGLMLPASTTRAVLVIRLATLGRGYSGVSFRLLEGLAALIQHDLLPCIPEEGSVGASGDLTPLSYVAAVLCGEREVLVDGRCVAAAEALASSGIRPLALRPKEAIAILNGTAVMSAIACESWASSHRIARLAEFATACNCVAIGACGQHFDAGLFTLKPHPGSIETAMRIREAIGERLRREPDCPLQLRYSLRCAPHVIGTLHDALTAARIWIETELLGVDDNPIVDPDRDRILHGGNFYGGHVAMAMDLLKPLVASVAELLERQIALLVDPQANGGMPACLAAVGPSSSPIDHGVKGLQIAASAWTAEAMGHASPSSIHSRSTESHNQDKVSMGTIAARGCRRVLELSEQVVAAALIVADRALSIRARTATGLRAVRIEVLRERLECFLGDRATRPDRLDHQLRYTIDSMRDPLWLAAAGLA